MYHTLTTDIKGKKVSWLGEVILPFVEASRLIREVDARASQLTPKEASKNIERAALLFCNKLTVEQNPALQEELKYIKRVDNIPFVHQCFFRELENDPAKLDQE